jgi:hypothetical protein
MFVGVPLALATWWALLGRIACSRPIYPAISILRAERAIGSCPAFGSPAAPGAAKRRTPSPVVSLTPREQGMAADASRDRILRRVKL